MLLVPFVVLRVSKGVWDILVVHRFSLCISQPAPPSTSIHTHTIAYDKHPLHPQEYYKPQSTFTHKYPTSVLPAHYTESHTATQYIVHLSASLIYTASRTFPGLANFRFFIVTGKNTNFARELIRRPFASFTKSEKYTHTTRHHEQH